MMILVKELCVVEVFENWFVYEKMTLSQAEQSGVSSRAGRSLKKNDF